MDIDLRRLRHVVTLARARHYHRAAREIGISQPALTKSIQATEAELGLTLFDRGRSGVDVTPAGAPIIELARELLEQAELLRKHASRFAAAEEGNVAFGIAPLPAQALLRSGLEAAFQQAPGVSCHAIIRDASALADLLLADEIEFFIAAEGQFAIRSAIGVELLGRFPVSLIVRSGHPLLSDPNCGQKFPLFLASPVPGFAIGSADLLEHLSGVVHVIEDYSALTKLTGETNGIWLSSRFAVSDEIAAAQLAELPWPSGSTPPLMQMAFYSLARRTVSPAASRLKRIFKARVLNLSKSF